MFEKTNEIINKATPDSFLYMLWGLKENSLGFYHEDGNGFIDPFTSHDFFETARESAEYLFDEKMCDEDFVEEKTGFRCTRYALHKMTDEFFDEFKDSIFEEEYFYSQEQYEKKLNWAKEHRFYPECPELGEKAFPYWYLTEEFVDSWNYSDLYKYCKHNHKFYVGNSCLCKIGYYKDFIFVYDCTDGSYYVGSQDYKWLEDYTPAENIDDDDADDDNEDDC